MDCQKFDSNLDLFSQISRQSDEWARRLKCLPEYAGYSRVSTLVAALARLALTPWGRRHAPACAVRARRLLEPPGTCSPEEAEALVLGVYAELHEVGSGYSPEERRTLVARKGYFNYAGGLSPVLAAGRYLAPSSVSIDLGAGNGLQGLLFQCVYPHRKTIQVELSGQLIGAGRRMQAELGIPADRVVWLHADVATVSLEGVDLVYLYRPARPEGKGEELYRRIARSLEDAAPGATVMSVADCLGPYLGPSYERLFSDGHLTCYRRRGRWASADMGERPGRHDETRTLTAVAPVSVDETIDEIHQLHHWLTTRRPGAHGLHLGHVVIAPQHRELGR